MAKGTRFGKRGSGGAGPPMFFGIIWTAFSSIFVVVGLWGTVSESRVQVWDEVPCTIEKFEITATMEDDPPFRPDVVFNYEHGGKKWEGTKLWREKKGVDDYEDLAELREELWSNLDASCRVNPDVPNEAILIMDQSGIWGGLAFAAFGGAFVLVGVGMIVAAIKGKKAKAVSATGDKEMGGLLGCGFFGAFAAAGLGILFGVVVPKALSFFEMRSWEEVPAEVIWSRVLSHSGDDGTTYSVDVFYKYKIGDREFRSNRWNVVGGSSSGRGAKQDVVKAHPPGKNFVCYVNSDEPWRAVVNREVGWAGLFALFPLPFIAVGLGGLWYTFVRKPKKAAGSTESGGGLRQAMEGEGMRSDRKESAKSGGSRRSRIYGFIGAIFIAVFWNGIVSVFVGIAWKGWQRGQPEWFLIIFLIPFLLVGLFLIFHVPYRFLAIFSPVYELNWGDETLAPGDRGRLSWRRKGGGGQPRRLTIWLVGQEEATHRRGKNTTTAISVFHEARLFESESFQVMRSGTCDLTIPEDGVPSFSGEHNKLRWFLRFKVDVPWRPDVSEEHELEIGNPKGLE